MPSTIRVGDLVCMGRHGVFGTVVSDELNRTMVVSVVTPQRLHMRRYWTLDLDSIARYEECEDDDGPEG